MCHENENQVVYFEINCLSKKHGDTLSCWIHFKDGVLFQRACSVFCCFPVCFARLTASMVLFGPARASPVPLCLSNRLTGCVISRCTSVNCLFEIDEQRWTGSGFTPWIETAQHTAGHPATNKGGGSKTAPIWIRVTSDSMLQCITTMQAPRSRR